MNSCVRETCKVAGAAHMSHAVSSVGGCRDSCGGSGREAVRLLLKLLVMMVLLAMFINSNFTA